MKENINIISELAEDIASSIERDRESVIKTSINEAIGEGWTLESVKDKITSIRFDGAKYTRYLLDGKYLVTIGDVELKSDGARLTASFSFDADHPDQSRFDKRVGNK